MFRPTSKSFTLTVERDTNCVAAILILLLTMNPNAIARTIVPVYVLAFNRMIFRWSVAHILNEGFKALPSLANAYATSTVMFVVRSAWRIATSSHVLPYSMFKRPTQSMCRIAIVAVELATTAAFRVAAFKIAHRNNRVVSAFTLAFVKAQHSITVESLFNKFNYFQTSKLASNQG